MVGPEQGEDTSPSPLLIQTFVDTSLLETGLPSDSKMGLAGKGANGRGRDNSRAHMVGEKGHQLF